MTRIELEYGNTRIPVELPSGAAVITAGTPAVPDPSPVDPVAATRQALAAPLGTRPLRELAKAGDRVVVAFPDRVKGGSHQHSHRRVAIPIVVEELERAGVRPENITLVCAVGLHRKNTEAELREYLGHGIVDGWWPHRLVCHDAEDPDGIVSFGHDALGDVVQFNRAAAEADLTILIGHVAGNPYGGYSGGYKMPATGLTTWQSIRSHHTPASLHAPDFVPVTTHSRFRHQLTAVGRRIESIIGKPFFTLDAVIGTNAEVLGVYAGITDLVERASWPLADRRTNVWLTDRFDALVVGLPRTFHYGPGMGSNPVLALQAIAATIVRCVEVLEKPCTVIAACQCDGWFNDEWFPATREAFAATRGISDSGRIASIEEDLSTRADYVESYRNAFAYHPFHAFSMLHFGALAHRHAARILLVGAARADIAEAMGCEPVDTFSNALAEARRTAGGPPRILALPGFLTRTPVHLRYGAA